MSKRWLVLLLVVMLVVPTVIQAQAVIPNPVPVTTPPVSGMIIMRDNPSVCGWPGSKC